jgi:hypothetical protein
LRRGICPPEKCEPAETFRGVWLTNVNRSLISPHAVQIYDLNASVGLALR